MKHILDTDASDDETKYQECQNLTEEWQDLKKNNNNNKNIDNITDLSKRRERFSARVINLDPTCNWMHQFLSTEMSEIRKKTLI